MNILYRRKIDFKSEQGQSLTEFALALPMLALLLFAVIQFGVAFNNYVTLTDATRAGARKAAVGRQSVSPVSDCQAAIRGSAKDLTQSEPDPDLHLDLAAGSGRDRDCDLPLQDQPARTRREDGTPLEHNHGACGMNSRSDRGQATVLTLVFLVVLLGMAALVLDIGSWYRADRATQSTADAAALAGAQALPSNPGNANTLALQYVTKNGGGTPTVSLSTKYLTNDTVKVNVTKPAQGVFTKLFGVRTVTVGSHASARASLMDQAKYVAPIGVNILNPKLKGTATCPCFGSTNLTTLPLGKTGAPGSFDLINIDESHGGTGPSILARLDPEGLRRLPLARRLLLGRRREVELVGGAERARRPQQHRAALPRLRHDQGHGLERAVPRDRVGRLPHDRLTKSTAAPERSPAGSRRSCGPVSPLPTATGQPNLGARVVNLVD